MSSVSNRLKAPSKLGFPCFGREFVGFGFGFTLLELLAVITIISLLAAVLLPVSSRAKGAAQACDCKNNLRQLGIAFRMYLDVGGEAYPYTACVPAACPKGVSYWFDALSLALPEAKWGAGLFKCPAYQGIAFEGRGTRNSQGQLSGVYSPCGSYAYNASGRRDPQPGPSGLVSAGLGFTISDGRAIGQPIRETDVAAPADLYVVGDSPLVTAQWGMVSQPRLGGAADYNAFSAGDVSLEKVQHSVLFNMLLADAHTESIQTKLLLHTNRFSRSKWNHDNQP